MALFQVIGEYQNPQGVCFLCKASKRVVDRPERLITTDIDLNAYLAQEGWNGPLDWLEFCETCVSEMGHLMGMLDEGQVSALSQTIEQLMNARESAEAELADVRRQLDSAAKALEYFGPKNAVPKK